jgi:hypothetical protein
MPPPDTGGVSRVSRDQGLKRISLVTRWVGVAGIVGAGLFAALVAKSQPGRTAVTTPLTTPAVNESPASSAALSTVSPYQVDPGLQAPDQAPLGATGPAAAVSGGS